MDESRQERSRWYREQGWWPGERLQDRYARVVEARADELAVVDDRGRRYTHAQLWQRSQSLADGLAAHGLRARDVALIFMPNWAEWSIALLAVLRLGAVPANIPIRTDTETLHYAAELCDARVLIASERHGASPTGDMARAAAARAHRRPVLSIDEQGGTQWYGEPAGTEIEGVRSPELDHLMFTSSTTGLPKAVMHTADTLAALHIGFSERFALGPDQPIFMPSPLGHSVGCIHGARLSLYNGAPLVLQDRWDPQTALAMVARHGCTFTAAATPFLKDLVDAPWNDARPKLDCMRWFLCGGAQVPPALMQNARQQMPNTFVTVLWGMTEGGLTTCLAESAPEKLLHTAGAGLPGLELCVLGADASKLPPGEEGELAMRGPGVFVGYYAQKALYRSLLTRDGFFRTGDLACIDEQGYVRITGRIKDLIVRGGVNISPVPIEDALAAHPGVQAVAVIGYPHERLGERICAVVIANRDAVPGAGVLEAFVRDRGLPKHLWPELVRFVDDFPRTAAGKIRKLELRQRIVDADAGADAGAKSACPPGSTG
ncbi:MAG: class I adenylate-forming enzyme family protein [Gammaproteobacteria bacterium]